MGYLIASLLWMLPNPSPLAQGRPLVYRAYLFIGPHFNSKIESSFGCYLLICKSLFSLNMCIASIPALLSLDKMRLLYARKGIPRAKSHRWLCFSPAACALDFVRSSSAKSMTGKITHLVQSTEVLE